MRVMLFVPPGGYFAERWSGGNMMPALGLTYIAAVLEQNGIEVELVPTHVLDMSWADIARKVESDRPGIVGIQASTENRFLSFELARVAKRAFPPTFVVLGGPHCKATAHDTLTHIPEVDGVVSGEGEYTTLELARALEGRGNLSTIPGLSFRHNGHITHNPPRSLIPDLNALPLPARHLEPWEKYNFKVEVPGHGLLPAVNIMTSRGCPFTCTFCATPTNWGTRVRGLTPENVVREIEHLMGQYGTRVIWFYDDTFNYNRKRTAEICDLIIERRLGIHWYCEVRVDILTKDLLARMREAGLFYVGFGIESGSERICREIITKRATLKQAYDVIDWCNEFGVIPNPFFIFSHPTETWEEAQETIRVIEEVKDRAEASVSLLHIYPGTPLVHRALEEGKLPKDFSWTKKRDRRVVVLPAAQGHAPLYLDRLTWPQICQLLIRFSQAHKKINIFKKISKVLPSISSFDDLKRYVILGLTYVRFRLLYLWGRRRRGRPTTLSRKVSA